MDRLDKMGAFEWIFPQSQPYYPLDSIKEVNRARAAAMVNRLTGLSGEERTYAIDGWKSVPLAELAAAAGNDSMARRIFETRISALSNSPAEKSFVLLKAVSILATPTQDSARLARNMVLAEGYLKRLHAIPSGGYKTKHDSLAVLERQWRGEDTVLPAYAALGDVDKLLEHARRLMSYVTVLGFYERGVVVGQAWQRVFDALTETREHRGRLQAFEPTVLEMARLAEVENKLKDMIDRANQWLALFDHPAPPIVAHAWLNTPDSLYDSIPRKRTFDDGRVHVLMFLRGLEDQTRPGVLSRIQQEFGKDVDVLLVLNTEGYAGPDIVEPRVEVEWLKRYLIGRRHLTIPMAIWAGSKVPDGFVPEGHYAVRRPEPELNSEPYHLNSWGTSCALIDKHGVVRYFLDAKQRTDEVKVRQRVRELIAEPASSPSR